MPSPAYSRARIRYSAGLYRRPSRRCLLRRTSRHVRWDRSSGVIFIGRMHGFSALPALCSMRTADYSSPSTLMRSMLARSAPAKNPQHWFYTFEISRYYSPSLGAKYLKALYRTKEGCYAHDWNERLHRWRGLLYRAANCTGGVRREESRHHRRQASPGCGAAGNRGGT